MRLSSTLPPPKTTHWDTYWSTLEGIQPEAKSSPEIKMAAQRVFGLSDFVFWQAMRNPIKMYALLKQIEKEKELFVPTKEEYETLFQVAFTEIVYEGDILKILREVRNWEMVRIAWNDLTRKASLQETLISISNLADAAVSVCATHVTQQEIRRFGMPLAKDGTPQQLIVIAMGKLGTRELNFSSDIDLIFAYPTTGYTSGKNSISCEEFFTRVGKRLIALLSDMTEDGFVFRVDMRLRPHGEKGPLVVSFDRMLQYYELMGRDWERYAWIKGRVIGGDVTDGQWLMDRMKSFVYRRYLDYANFASLRSMKEKIAYETMSEALQNDIKQGPGGIREIEFFCQIFQLVRGGVLPSLQRKGVLQVLQILLEEGLIVGDVYDDLTTAYIFLRDTENRLQMAKNQQIHTLPFSDEDQKQLSFSMGFDTWTSFKSQLDLLRKKVNFHFQKLLESSSEAPVNTGLYGQLITLWNTSFDTKEGWNVLANVGYNNPKNIARMIETFKQSSSTQHLSADGRDRLCQLIPRIVALAAGTIHPSSALRRMLDLLETIERRTCYLYLLIENPLPLKRLVILASQSSWIISFVSRHPALLDEIVDLGGDYNLLKQKSIEKLFHKRLEGVTVDDLESQMETFALLKQYFILRVATVDIAQRLALMQVSDQLSLIAESILEEVLSFTWTYLTERHGVPVCDQNNTPADITHKGFAIVAGGKLGGYELGYVSDLDLIFLHEGDDRETTGGARPIDGRQFYARLGQRLLHTLSTPTSAGVTYEVDTRLRPNGRSGVLVSHINMFREYQLKDAWVWEHQALVRSRAVAGDPAMMKRFEEMRREILSQPRDAKELASAVMQMRDRLREEKKGQATGFHLKHGEGGMMDIEFLVQYLILQHAHQHPTILKYTDIVRQIHMLLDENIIDEATAYCLRKAYLVFRAVAHRLSLQERSAVVGKKRYLTFRKAVIKHYNQAFQEILGK